MDELDNDPTLRIGVITGSHKAFCAGMDLKAYLQGDMPATDVALPVLRANHRKSRLSQRSKVLRSPAGLKLPCPAI